MGKVSAAVWVGILGILIAFILSPPLTTPPLPLPLPLLPPLLCSTDTPQPTLVLIEPGLPFTGEAFGWMASLGDEGVLVDATGKRVRICAHTRPAYRDDDDGGRPLDDLVDASASLGDDKVVCVGWSYGGALFLDGMAGHAGIQSLCSRWILIDPLLPVDGTDTGFVAQVWLGRISFAILGKLASFGLGPVLTTANAIPEEAGCIRGVDPLCQRTVASPSFSSAAGTELAGLVTWLTSKAQMPGKDDDGDRVVLAGTSDFDHDGPALASAHGWTWVALPPIHSHMFPVKAKVDSHDRAALLSLLLAPPRHHASTNPAAAASSSSEANTVSSSSSADTLR